MIGPTDRGPRGRPDGVLLDLLMAVMDSVAVWSAAAGDERRGLAWRDATTARMTAARRYVPYEELAAAAARDADVPSHAVVTLVDAWRSMEPRPDAGVLHGLPTRYAFVTNCSARLAAIAAGRSRLEPSFVLSAEDAGWYKPDRRTYLEACRRLGTSPRAHAIRRGLGLRRGWRRNGGTQDCARRAAWRPATARRPERPSRRLPRRHYRPVRIRQLICNAFVACAGLGSPPGPVL